MCVCACVLSVRFTSCIAFFNILNELNDYAGQREVVAEEMGHRVYGELMRYSHDLKTERKMVISIILLFNRICLNEWIYLFTQFNGISRFHNTFIKHILKVILHFYVLISYSY